MLAAKLGAPPTFMGIMDDFGMFKHPTVLCNVMNAENLALVDTDSDEGGMSSADADDADDDIPIIDSDGGANSEASLPPSQTSGLHKGQALRKYCAPGAPDSAGKKRSSRELGSDESELETPKKNKGGRPSRKSEMAALVSDLGKVFKSELVKAELQDTMKTLADLSSVVTWYIDDQGVRDEEARRREDSSNALLERLVSSLMPQLPQ
jgi:hypothetical protein